MITAERAKKCVQAFSQGQPVSMEDLAALAVSKHVAEETRMVMAVNLINQWLIAQGKHLNTPPVVVMVVGPLGDGELMQVRFDDPDNPKKILLKITGETW